MPSITEGGRESRKEQGNHLLQVSGREASAMQQEVRSCFGEECGDVGSGPENEDQTVGAKEKARRN